MGGDNELFCRNFRLQRTAIAARLDGAKTYFFRRDKKRSRSFRLIRMKRTCSVNLLFGYVQPKNGSPVCSPELSTNRRGCRLDLDLIPLGLSLRDSVARQRCDCLRILSGSLSVLLAQKYHLRTGTEQIGGAVCVGREPCVELDEKSEERRDVGLLNLTESAGEVGLQQSFSWGRRGVEKAKSLPHNTKTLTTRKNFE